MTDRWIEVGDGVLVRRHDELDLSAGLVLGDRGCLLVDTRGDVGQGAQLAAAVRSVTPLPWQVALSHAHFDHCLGTAALLPAHVWAHPGCRDDLARGGARQHAEARGWRRGAGHVTPVVPDRMVAARTELDVGGRRVLLDHLGRGHTDHDVVVSVPDAGVVFAGDLVEQGAPPAFEDAFPREWPGTVTALLGLGAGTVVPGHGEPVDGCFVAGQRDELTDLAAACVAVATGELDVAGALRRSPYDAATTRIALYRTAAVGRASNLPPGPFRPHHEGD
ncbi:MAG: MBL fold metallo-hydrolase [Pseudonocardiaceae bacterium]|nr:MBL fold metallo-hydrolase [Pseudonocardiaceae bacterium]